MEGGDSEAVDAEMLQRIKDSRNISELFHGRLTDKEGVRLLRRFEWDRQRTVGHILNAGPGELAELLDVDADIETRANYVKRNDVLRDLAMRNEIGDCVRQFACQECDKMWWRRVPNRKQVARCFRCKRKYDPIPRDSEWGWAEFNCECGNTFNGTGHMGRSQSMCFQCRRMCFPTKILPPFKTGENPRQSRNKHSCAGENCFNRKGLGILGQICLHPRSLPRAVQVPSQRHVSTGSTVNTFLNQDDLEPAYEPSLYDIPDVSDEEDGN